MLIYNYFHPVIADVEAFHALINSVPSVHIQIAPALVVEYLNRTITPYFPAGLSVISSVLHKNIQGAFNDTSKLVMVVGVLRLAFTILTPTL